MNGLVAVESLDSTLDDQSLDDKDDISGNLGIPTILNVSVSIGEDIKRQHETRGEIMQLLSNHFFPQLYNP